MSRDYAYASYSDVRAHLSFVPTFLATSLPNASQVAQHLNDASNLLDAALAQANYLTPIATTATAALDLCRTWTAVGAAQRTARSMPQGQDSKHLLPLTEEWSAILAGIADGDLVLPDAPKDAAVAAARYGAVATGASPVFLREDATLLR